MATEAVEVRLAGLLTQYTARRCHRGGVRTFRHRDRGRDRYPAPAAFRRHRQRPDERSDLHPGAGRPPDAAAPDCRRLTMTLIGQTLTTPYEAAARRDMHAINGKFLQVDLTTGRLWLEEHDAAFYRRYIGGRGAALYYLLTQMPASADPLGPDNLLVFAPGVLTGTIMPGSGRHGVGAKSPLTGALASGEAGGWWGSELKRAGFDGIVIRGRAEQPVYLWVHDGQVEIRTAAALVGPAHRRYRRGDPGGAGRRQDPGRHHRAGGRAAGALRRHHAHAQPGGRPLRPGRGDGQQEPEGGCRARLPAAWPGRQESDEPSRQMAQPHLSHRAWAGPWPTARRAR